MYHLELHENCGVAGVIAPKGENAVVIAVKLGAVEFKNGAWRVKPDKQIAEEINADSVAFLSMDGRISIRRQFGESTDDFCGYCHRDNGPSFDMSKYDKGLLLEELCYNHAYD